MHTPITSKTQAAAAAKRLLAVLRRTDPSAKLALAYEGLAAMMGHRNWDTLAATLVYAPPRAAQPSGLPYHLSVIEPTPGPALFRPLVDRVRNGTSVVVEAPPGIGKSTLFCAPLIREYRGDVLHLDSLNSMTGTSGSRGGLLDRMRSSVPSAHDIWLACRTIAGMRNSPLFQDRFGAVESAFVDTASTATGWADWHPAVVAHAHRTYARAEPQVHALITDLAQALLVPAPQGGTNAARLFWAVLALQYAQHHPDHSVLVVVEDEPLACALAPALLALARLGPASGIRMAITCTSAHQLPLELLEALGQVHSVQGRRGTPNTRG